MATPTVVGQTDVHALLVAASIPIATILALAWWISLDARAREEAHPYRWAAWVGILPPLVALYVRRRNPRSAPPSARERLSLMLLLSLLLAVMIGTVFAPPDVFAHTQTSLAGLVVALPLFYLIVYRTGDTTADQESAP